MKYLNLVGQRFGKLIVECPATINRNKRKDKIWKCLCDCGNYKDVSAKKLRGKNTKSCGCLKTEIRGGRHKNHEGYAFIAVQDPTIYKDKRRKNYNRSNHYLGEHIVVMSKHIGRPLTKDETVHHVNGKRDDNRLENLELWSSSHPRGQRVEDLVKWAEEILSRYKDVPKARI